VGKPPEGYAPVGPRGQVLFGVMDGKAETTEEDVDVGGLLDRGVEYIELDEVIEVFVTFFTGVVVFGAPPAQYPRHAAMYPGAE